MNRDQLRQRATPFFNYARERYWILLNRRAGLPREEWTADPVLQQWSFCNIFREDDRVTEWFRENIRGPLQNRTDVVFATIAFRWFNSIGAGEVMKPFLLSGDWPISELKRHLEARRAQDGKIVTGAYIIKTPPGLSKIDALLSLIHESWYRCHEVILPNWNYDSLEKSWELLLCIPYQGQFTAYEIVTDLYYTKMLEKAKDVDTWANPGPGCAGGLGQLFYGDFDKFNRTSKSDREEMIELMQFQLELSKDNEFWPKKWPVWNMRTAEHTNCEYFKYVKAQQGLRLKRRYR